MRISHSMKAEKSPNFWSLMGRKEKKEKEQDLGREEEMSGRGELQCERISISRGFKTSPADRDMETGRWKEREIEYLNSLRPLPRH